MFVKFIFFGGGRFWGDVEPGWFEVVAAVPTQRNGTGHKGKLVGDGKRGTFFFLLLLFMSLVPSMVASMEDQQNVLTGNTLGIQPHQTCIRNKLGIHWECIGNTCIPMQMNQDNFG